MYYKLKIFDKMKDRGALIVLVLGLVLVGIYFSMFGFTISLQDGDNMPQ